MNDQQQDQQGEQTGPRYVPRQLLLLVEHVGALRAKQLVRLLDWAHQTLGEARLVSRRVLSFPKAEKGERFSLVFTDVAGLKDDRQELIVLLQRLEKLLDRSQGQVTLRSVSPNWFGMRAPQHVGGGGPGARPVPARFDSDSATQYIEDWQTKDVDEPGTPFGFRLSTLPLGRAKKDSVEVAILDTAPCTHDLARAYHTWHAEHPLIRSLLGANSPLSIRYAALDDLNRLAGYSLPDHDYEMADHGLFVAGIIHTIAPRARLRLVEVLNPQGIGDIESIARGLKYVLKHRGNQPLVVNCSFVVNIPRPEQRDELAKEDPAWNAISLEMIKRMAWPLQWICDALADHDVLLVAAAGNDAAYDNNSDPNTRPPARYPAAFDSVLGVGALNPNGSVADYSNIADTPTNVGIVTLGGSASDSITNPDDGMLGVFISPFQSKDGTITENQDGWGRWAGTSFAAPVVSGAIAALIALATPSTDAIRTIRDAQADMTALNEEILSVQQGVPLDASPTRVSLAALSEHQRIVSVSRGTGNASANGRKRNGVSKQAYATPTEEPPLSSAES